jgi:hypothetical protein
MNGETRDIIMNVYIKITTRNMKLVFVKYHLQEYDGNKCEYHLHTLSNISNLCASDEGYSRRNASCALNLISTFLLKEYKYTVEKTEYTIKDHRQH